MALPDISELTVTELESLVKACTRQIKSRQAAKKKELAKQFKALAKSEGLDVDEIMAAQVAKPSKVSTTKKKGKKGKRGKVAPKYANPNDASQKWTGRGRKPAWVVDALAAGSNMDDLLI